MTVILLPCTRASALIGSRRTVLYLSNNHNVACVIQMEPLCTHVEGVYIIFVMCEKVLTACVMQECSVMYLNTCALHTTVMRVKILMHIIHVLTLLFVLEQQQQAVCLCVLCCLLRTVIFIIEYIKIPHMFHTSHICTLWHGSDWTERKYKFSTHTESQQICDVQCKRSLQSQTADFSFIKSVPPV